jgi:hypothetical protein
MLFIISTRLNMTSVAQLKTVVFLHWCLVRAVLLYCLSKCVLPLRMTQFIIAVAQVFIKFVQIFSKTFFSRKSSSALLCWRLLWCYFNKTFSSSIMLLLEKS